MKLSRKVFADIIEILIEGGAVKATKYLAENQIVRGTRRTYGGKIIKGNMEIVLTIGKPNYAEREFIKKCKKAKEPFPVKRIQIKFPKGK